MSSEIPELILTISDQGKIFNKSVLVENEELLQDFFTEMQFAETGALISKFDETPCLVEYSDEPLIAKKVFANEDAKIFIATGTDLVFQVEPKSLSIDEWDRYHGLIAQSNNLPFVFSDKAQNDFFNLVDSFTDDSFTWKGQTFNTPEYWFDENEVEAENFWTHIYQTEEPRWDLGQPAPGLTEYYPKLKLPISRVIVIGGGSGHDAAFFAQHGHHVTLVDISSAAIARAQKQYGHYDNLHFLQADVFDLPKDLFGNFDLVFEHTCYCAINPQLRNELIKIWSSLLHESGQIFGVFFIMEKRKGPPFGGSEWELKNRFKDKFKTLIWQRFKNSIKGRWGKELVVLAQKRPKN
jgi:hypothetical protein